MSKQERYVYVGNTDINEFGRLLSTEDTRCTVELFLSGNTVTVPITDLLVENQVHARQFQWILKTEERFFHIIFATFISPKECIVCWQHIDIGIYDTCSIERDIQPHGYQSLEHLKEKEGSRWKEVVALCIAKNHATSLGECVDIQSLYQYLASHGLREGECGAQ